MTTRVLLCLVLVAACGGEHRPARGKFNTGVAALAKGDFEGATKNLLAARGEAGVDPELRYRAAYDLGVAFAAMADKSRRGEQKDLQKALEQAGQALSWFGDAARQKPGDAQALANQATMRVRVQAITDELRKAEGKLEARLDAAVKDQRALLDGVQQAWLAVQKGGGSDPLAQQGALSALADRERGIVAEVGAISDLAADEIDEIGKKPDDKRSDEEKVRVVQLKNLDIYLLEARARIAETRRKLQDLDGESAVGRADAALASLKRAREQLLDPITVMKGLMTDEMALGADTNQATTHLENPLALGSAATPAPDARPRPWLAGAALAERQNGLHDRLEEVRARLEAAVTPPPADQAAGQPPAQPEDPKQTKMKARVAKALPFVVAGSSAMDRARQSLGDSQFPPALEQERAAIEAIASAIEEFSDLKQTVELAHGEQEQIGQLLSPEAAKQLPADQRATETKAALARNVSRLARVQGLIADELADKTAELAKAQAQPAAPPQPGQPPPPSKEELEKQLTAIKDKYAKAEELRTQAQAALTALDAALATAGDPQVPNAEATAKLQELRMLFFSLVEHLQQLIRDQGETRDRTTTLETADDSERGAKLPEVVARETQHGGMAQAITDELAKQADAAAKQAQQPQPGQPDAKALAGAAAEMREAIKAMGDAKTGMAKVQAATGTSESLQPTLASEGTAIEHLEAALKLLQPPPKQDQNKDQQGQDQKQPPPQQPKPQDQPPQQKPGGAGQAARDQDANQQRKRRDEPPAADPVDKDW